VPRAGLTPQAVVAEAERMVDEAGLERLTLAALAERLGVRQPSLYKHIDGVAGLRRAITIRAGRELTGVLSRAAVGRARGDAVAAVAGAYREWAHAHPDRYQLSTVAPEPADAEVEAVAAGFLTMFGDVLSGFGLTGEDAIDAIRGIRSALHGFVSLEAAGAFAMPRDIDRSFRRLVSALIVALDHWSDESNAATETLP
jgi:AcrR family transcriptional regulator